MVVGDPAAARVGMGAWGMGGHGAAAAAWGAWSAWVGGMGRMGGVGRHGADTPGAQATRHDKKISCNATEKDTKKRRVRN